MVSTSKIRSAVEESWRGSPLTQLAGASCRWSISSGVTSHGPIGLNPGALFPFDHCPPEISSCHSRSERSFADDEAGDVPQAVGRESR